MRSGSRFSFFRFAPTLTPIHTHMNPTARQSHANPAPSDIREGVPARVIRFAPRKKALRAGAWFARKYAAVFKRLAE